MNELSSYSREELEAKLIHMTAFIAYHLANEYVERTEPTAKIIRTAEAEEENDRRVAQFMVCCLPAWDVIEITHPGYELMRDWVVDNCKSIMEKPCLCDGCNMKIDKPKA